MRQKSNYVHDWSYFFIDRFIWCDWSYIFIYRFIWYDILYQDKKKIILPYICISSF